LPSFHRFRRLKYISWQEKNQTAGGCGDDEEGKNGGLRLGRVQPCRVDPDDSFAGKSFTMFDY
jgi:hypothetical protein